METYIPEKSIKTEEALKYLSVPNWVVPVITPVIEKLFSISRFNRILNEINADLVNLEDDQAYFTKVLRVMGIHFEIDSEDFERIPKSGPLIVVANHPFGAIDGVVLGALLRGVRPDTKLLVNYLLSKLKGIRGNIIQVDPFERESSKQANLNGMREAIRLLRDGGCLGVFPAGEVASYQHSERAVVDPAWSSHVVNLARKTGAQILPIYFEGTNSRLFHLMGMLHPRFRTILLAREFCNKEGQEVKLRVGKLIESKQLETFENKAAATEYLRLKTYKLKTQKPMRKRLKFRLPFRSASANRTIQSLAPAQSIHRLRREIDQLPATCRLVEHGDFEVYCAAAKQIPSVLKELGRLREETFRAVQEGTGLARDLDEFDDYYLHLFMWNRAEDEIVGAYRIGQADKIIKEHGKQGLYTSTLFRYRAGFLDKLGPAIELGRSFICLKYQKKHATLALLWRGIGEYIVRHPEYKTLFGPVSITDAYNNISKDLMVHFFREHKFDNEMSRYVRARNAPKASTMLKGVSLKQIGESINSVDSVSAIISGFEDDKKGVPILLRHYLKLNGVLLSFNVDPAFSDVIDGLVLVDLAKTEKKVLLRYMGKEGYQDFITYHGLNSDEAEIPTTQIV